MTTDSRQYSNPASLFDELKAGGFELKAPVNVDQIAEKLGIIVETDHGLEMKGIIGEIFFRNDQPVVKINPFQNSYEPRRRFTLAHEIGHYCLHSAKSRQGFTDSQKTMSRSDSFWNRAESEANSFAAQLLMPKSLIIQEGQAIVAAHKAHSEEAISHSVFTEQMADKFQVSSKAMEYRLRNLGVIK